MNERMREEEMFRVIERRVSVRRGGGGGGGGGVNEGARKREREKRLREERKGERTHS